MRRRRLFSSASAVALLLCVTTIALWIWSQWTFTRVTCTYAKGSCKQQDIAFLMWRDAAEVMLRTNVYRPNDEKTRSKLLRDLRHEPFLDVYQRSGWLTSEGGASDAADHWGFWYRSPDASRRATLAVSYTKRVGGAEYSFTEEHERAFFLPWWFLVALFGCLPVKGMIGWLRRSLRAWGGRCLTCGHDIRYSSDRCGECGTPINATELQGHRG